MSYNITEALKPYIEADEAFVRSPEGEAADDLWITVTTIAVEIVNDLAELKSPQVIEGGVVIEVRGGIVRAVHDATDGTRVAAEVHDYDVVGQDEQDLERDADGELYIRRSSMIRHTFDAGITTADGETHWAQEAWDDAEEALAHGLEWAASRIRDKAPRARKILVAHTVTDDDYGNTITFDGEYMVTVIGQD